MAARDPAPGPLATVQAFVNTLDLEGAPSCCRTPRRCERGSPAPALLDGDAAVGAAEHARAIALREALRDVLSGDDAAVARVNEAGERAGLRPVLRRGGGSALEPTAGGVDGALGRLVAIVHGAVADGTWAHLKACERDRCRWAFYDHSKNHSGRWCDMDVCGAEEKSARAYRRRRAQRS